MIGLMIFAERLECEQEEVEVKNDVNLRSYEGVESVQGALSDREFKEYCDKKLVSCTDDLAFIKDNIYSTHSLAVCEIGTGNGKLLFAMEQTGILNGGVGYEVSKSRCECAERFKKLMGCNLSQIVNQNFLEDRTKRKFDLIIAVDIVIQFVSPLYDDAESDMFKWIAEHLEDGGVLYLELVDYSSTIEMLKDNQTIRTWEEFPEEDVYRYGLYSRSLDADGNVVKDKIFIRRSDGEPWISRNVVKSYSRDEICDVLKEYGFICELYPYKGINNENKDYYRVIARKSRRRNS